MAKKITKNSFNNKPIIELEKELIDNQTITKETISITPDVEPEIIPEVKGFNSEEEIIKILENEFKEEVINEIVTTNTISTTLPETFINKPKKKRKVKDLNPCEFKMYQRTGIIPD